ncbi:hypothetical protein ACO0LB_09190 [Undibacterium sp. SXout7W]|uniref:hypothetical protein n=1 Tax=Undibacterium sp. SXout7W TaxID=3413049 RepID=UPI003BEF7FFA
MDEVDDAKRELANAAVDFESGASGWKAYVRQLNTRLDGTEIQNSLLMQQIKILACEPRPDSLILNMRKILLEQKLKKKRMRQQEQVQNESLSLVPLIFIEPTIFKNGD